MQQLKMEALEAGLGLTNGMSNFIPFWFSKDSVMDGEHFNSVVKNDSTKKSLFSLSIEEN